MKFNHSMDIMKANVLGAQLPAADKGNPRAAKECGRYFSLMEEYDKAIKYYEQYLASYPNDIIIKMEVVSLKAKVLKSFF